MSRTTLGLVLAAALGPAVAFAQSSVDPDVQKGIDMVEEGDYDTAILTLDSAARRLSSDPAQVRDLSQAYLYLGIAYVGKGHEAAARAKFREALSRIRDMSLSPEKYPPKVIDLFEAAKEELREAGTTAPAAAEAAPQKKGGGSKTLLIVGGVAAAGGVAAIAAGGGGDGGNGAGSTTSGSSVTEGPFTGMLTLEEYCRGFNITLGSAGTLTAQATWQESNVELEIAVHRPPDYDTLRGQSNRTTQTSCSMTTELTPGDYEVALCHRGNSCEFGDNAGPSCFATYSLTMTHP